MSDLPEYIYRQGNRVKDLALKRKIDLLTGLSFYDYPIGKMSLKLDVQTLIQNGFVVRPDGKQPVKQLFTDEIYIEPNVSEPINFPDNHVTVWYPEPEYWQTWYKNDKANYGKTDISEELAYFALAIVKKDE